MSGNPQTAVPWSVAQHDTIPQVDLWLNPFETHVYLAAFLQAEGEPFVPPSYTPVREQVTRVLDRINDRTRQGQAPSATISESRLRTWKSVFEDFAFLQVRQPDNRIELTRLGRLVRGLFDEMNARIAGANDHLAKVATEVLTRYTLRNPIDAGAHPEDADVRPFQLIWRAMRALDDKLHDEELNRVLMHINYRRDEDAAIEHIRSVRAQLGGTYTAASAARLGELAVDQGVQTKRRITPWFTRAGFGGLLISAFDDDDGFRTLVPRHRTIFDDAIALDVRTPPATFVSREAYVDYLTDTAAIVGAQPSAEDEADIASVINAVERYGSTKVICLSGLPGTGKSRLGKMVAARIAEDDPYRFEEIQFHEGTSYDDFMEGFVAKPSGAGFELRPKIFRAINERAKNDPSGKTYVLLIEEFTRANVHAVLGELITYLEHRNRPFTLTLSQQKVYIAPNLVILATMNPRDKSALVLDHAIQRRLHVIPCPSSSAKLRTMLTGTLAPALLDDLVQWFHNHSSTLPFGQGVFALGDSADALRSLWAGTIRYFLTDMSGAVKEQYRPAEREYPWK